MDDFGLPQRTITTINAILTKHSKVTKAILYGSRAMGNYKPGSDIDLTLHGNDLDLHDLTSIMGELDDSSIPYLVDVSIFDYLDHAKLKDHIQRVGRVFYDRYAGWEMVRLGKVADVSGGNSAPQDERLFEGGVHPFVRTSDVGKIHKGIIYETQDKLNKGGIQKLRLFKKGAILFPKSGASTLLNHRVMLGVDAYVAAHLAAIKADNSKLIDAYLWYFLQTVDAAELIPDSGYPSLTIDAIADKIVIPLPPLAEQQRIVAKLDAAFAEIDKAIVATERKQEQAKALTQAALASELGHSADSAAVWQAVRLGDVATVIAGQSPKGENYNNDGNGLPFYQGKKNYGARYLNPPTVWTTKVTRKAIKDDILMSVRAPVGALNVATEEICIGRGLAVIRVKNGVIRDYLYFALLLTADRLNSSPGAIFDSINKKKIEEISLPLPPLAEQQRIVAKLDAIFAEGDSLQSITKKQIANYHALRSALLTQELQGAAS